MKLYHAFPQSTHRTYTPYTQTNLSSLGQTTMASSAVPVPVLSVRVLDSREGLLGGSVSLCASSRHRLVAMVHTRIDIFRVSASAAGPAAALAWTSRVEGSGSLCNFYHSYTISPCFAEDTDDPILIVPDLHAHTVYAFDVLAGCRVGTVLPAGVPAGTIRYPRAAASCGDRVAVLHTPFSVSTISIFRRTTKDSFADWAAIRSVHATTDSLCGLRFTEDGTGLWALERRHERLFCRGESEGGSESEGDRLPPLDFYHFMQRLDDFSRITQYDECGTTGCFLTQAGGCLNLWMIKKDSDDVDAKAAVRGALLMPGAHIRGFCMYGGLGLGGRAVLVARRMYDDMHRDSGLVLELLMTPDDAAMSCMSTARVAWMGTVARGIGRRWPSRTVALAGKSAAKGRRGGRRGGGSGSGKRDGK